jgi:hypothetical protein
MGSDEPSDEASDGSDWSWTAAPAIPAADGRVWVKLLAYDGEYSVSYVYLHPSPSEKGQSIYEADTWLADLWRAPSGDLFASGLGGRMHVYSGTSWNVIQTPGNSTLTCVWGFDSETNYATGDGFILRRDGINWTYFTQGHGAYIDYIRGSSPSDLYAVGRAGLLLHFDGKSWQRIHVPTNADLNAVCVVDADRVYIVGDHGVVLTGSQNSWSLIDCGEIDLVDVAVYREEVYVAANDDGLLRLQGAGLVPVKHAVKPVRLRSEAGFLCAAGKMSFARFDGARWDGFTYKIP